MWKSALLKLDNQIRFARLVASKELAISNVPRKDLVRELKQLGFKPQSAFQDPPRAGAGKLAEVSEAAAAEGPNTSL